MNKNYIEDLAKMLGVEIGEEFNIVNANGNKLAGCPYKCTGKSIVNCFGYTNYECLGRLVSGVLEIKKSPFIPKNGDYYYYVDVCGHVYKETHTGDTYDYSLIKLGNCFRTKEEVTQEIKNKIVKELTAGY